jgi:hypothetical protein
VYSGNGAEELTGTLMSNVEEIPLESLDQLDLLPLALFRRPTSYFEKFAQVRFHKAHDDLDYCVIAPFRVQLDRPGPPIILALRSYRGAPTDTVDVLLPAKLSGAPLEIARILHDLAEHWHLPMTDVAVPDMPDRPQSLRSDTKPH